MVSQHARPARLQVRGRRNSANRTSNELFELPNPIYSLLLYIWKDMDCDGDECDDFNPKVKLEIKAEKREETKKATETMHLMTVACGRPNYQVNQSIFFSFQSMLTINIGNQRHQKATRSKFDNDQIGGIVRPPAPTHTRFHRGRYGTPV